MLLIKIADLITFNCIDELLPCFLYIGSEVILFI